MIRNFDELKGDPRWSSWYPHLTHKQNVRIREEWFRKNTKSSFYHDEEEK